MSTDLLKEFSPAKSAATVVNIPDVQARADSRQIAINRVGIKNIRHPLRFKDRDGSEQNTVATCTLSVALPHDVKGTHMSRFIELLNEREEALTTANFPQLLTEMADRLQAAEGYIELTFPYFVTKAAPVTGIRSLLDYEVSLLGSVHGNQTTTELKIVIPVTSLCPCSKEISEYGAHNQRSHVTLTATLKQALWIDDIIEQVEQQASAELFSVLKRADEKYVTETAYENPKFVEDLVRDIAASLNRNEHIGAYTVEVENFESIHNHSAYAMISRTE